LNICIFD